MSYETNLKPDPQNICKSYKHSNPNYYNLLYIYFKENKNNYLQFLLLHFKIDFVNTNKCNLLNRIIPSIFYEFIFLLEPFDNVLMIKVSTF